MPGSLVAALRRHRGWTQQAAAEHARSQIRTYQRWESGDSPISGAHWALLCVAAGVPETWRPAEAEVAP